MGIIAYILAIISIFVAITAVFLGDWISVVTCVVSAGAMIVAGITLRMNV